MGKYPFAVTASLTVISPSGDTTGVADVANIQKALTAARLAGGGLVRGQAGGVYYLGAQIVVGSGTTFDMTGCMVNEVAGTNAAPLVTNYSPTAPAATAADATVSSGSTITTSLGAVAVPGQSVTVAGAAAVASGILFCGLVSAQTSSNLTVTNLDGTTLAVGSAVSGAAISLWTRDTNITIRGGTWNLGTNVLPVSNTTFVSGFGITHCDYYELDIPSVTFTANGAGYAVLVQDVTRGVISVADAISSHAIADAVHVNGPCWGLAIPSVSGATGDDMVSLTGSNYPLTGTTMTSGNITGIDVGTIYGSSQESMFKVIAGAGNNVDQVRVSGQVNGNDVNGVWVGDDTNHTSTTGGTYGYIDLGKLRVRNNGNGMVQLFSPAADYIAADIDAYPDLGGNNSGIFITGSSTVTINTIRVTGSIDDGGGSLACYFLASIASRVTVKHALAVGCSLQGTSGNAAIIGWFSGAAATQADLIGCTVALTAQTNGYGVQVDSSSAISFIGFTGGYYDCLNLVNDASTVAVTCTIGGGLKSNTANVYLASAGSAVKTILTGGAFLTVKSSSAVFATTNAGLTAGGGPVTISGSNGLFSRAGSEVLRCDNPYLKAVVANLTQQAGDLAKDGSTGYLNAEGQLIVTNHAASLPGIVTIVGNSDTNQFSNFNLADNVFPLDAAGHYWSFSHRADNSVLVFSYNGSSYTNTLQMFESGTVQVLNGHLDVTSAGQGLRVKEGSNAKQGIATLASGAVVVSDTSVTANSRIFLTAQDNNSTGALRVSARSAGVSFTITSSTGTDSGVVAYEIFEPA
jgi:hypothetical protein